LAKSVQLFDIEGIEHLINFSSSNNSTNIFWKNLSDGIYWVVAREMKKGKSIGQKFWYCHNIRNFFGFWVLFLI